MELKAIFAVKRENLTEQDKIHLLDLEGKKPYLVAMVVLIAYLER